MFSLSGVMILSIFCSSEKYLMTMAECAGVAGTEGPPEVVRVHLCQLAGLPLRPPRHEALPDNLVRPPEVTRPVHHTFTRRDVTLDNKHLETSDEIHRIQHSSIEVFEYSSI